MRERGVRSSPLLAGLAVLAIAAAIVPHGILEAGGIADTGLYGQYGEQIAGGDVPYRDLFLEFPPGALPALVVPALVSDHAHYVLAFKLLQLLLLGVATAAVVLTVRALDGSVGRQTAAGVLVGLTPLLLGPIALNAFDAWPAALVSCGMLLLVRSRTVPGGILLGLGTAAKLYPALLAPTLLVAVHRRRGAREGVRLAYGWIVAAALVALPFVALAAGGLGFSLRTQLTRGLQIEGLGGSLLLAADALGLHPVRVRTASPHSFDVAGGLADAVGALSTVLQLAAVCLPAWLLWRRRRIPGREELVLAAAAATAGLIAFNKVFSPQYVVWLLPAVALVRPWSAWLLAAAAALLTRIWFPSRFADLTDGGPIALVVVARDLVVVALYALLVHRLATQTSPQHGEEDDEERVSQHGPPRLAVEVEGRDPAEREGHR